MSKYLPLPQLMTQPKIKQEDLKQEAAGDNLSISVKKRPSVIIYSTETCVDLLEARPCWLCAACAADK